MHVRYKIFISAIEYLPFSPDDDLKGSFEEIIERYTQFILKLITNFDFDKLFMWSMFCITEFCPGLVKLVLESMTSPLILQSNIACKANRKLWLFSGFALHLLPQLMMPELLLQSFSFVH